MGESLLVRRGGEANSTPVLDPNYPANATVWAGETATFQVQIATDGVPAEYTYQWYKNGNLITNATAATLNLTGLTTATTATIYCVVTNKAGEVTSRVATLTVKNPNMTYTYTGSHEKIDDGSGNWRIKFKSSGTLKFTNLGKWDGLIDVFLVGGGCAGGSGNWDANNGYVLFNDAATTETQKSIQAAVNTAYSIVIGAGGQSAFASGGSTSALGVTANGGTKLGGGSGGGAYGNTQVNNGGSDGGNGDPQDAANIGIDHWGSPGKGQGTTTREFGEPTGTLYAGGGGAGGNGSAQAHGGAGGGGNGAWNGHQPTSGEANTGGGGGGMYYNLTNVGKGGSGIAVIRNHR
jgi:hypothetical protein